MILPLREPVNPDVAIIDPVTVSPLVKATPPEIYDAVTANDAKLDVVAYELEIPEPPPLAAYEAVSAYELEMLLVIDAYDAVNA